MVAVSPTAAGQMRHYVPVPFRIIGYWLGPDAPGWPDAAEFVDDYADPADREEAAQRLDNGILTDCASMGYSLCRLCGKRNGDTERTDGALIWPDGLGHYVRDHHVRLPEEVEVLLRRTVPSAEEAVRQAVHAEPDLRDTAWWKQACASAVKSTRFAITAHPVRAAQVQPCLARPEVKTTVLRPSGALFVGLREGTPRSVAIEIQECVASTGDGALTVEVKQVRSVHPPEELFAELRDSVALVAALPGDQLAWVRGHGWTVDEIAQSLDDAVLVFSSRLRENGLLSVEISAALVQLTSHFKSFGGAENMHRWSEQALVDDPAWAEARRQAGAILGMWGDERVY